MTAYRRDCVGLQAWCWSNCETLQRCTKKGQFTTHARRTLRRLARLLKGAQGPFGERQHTGGIAWASKHGVGQIESF
ncbi:unnamed protein product [Bursaphelenchus okinawaensis]|uniref:Uncharacterized protein n=1 Tax=Bursaphelenchus okinawaensis TaxID=465554 RepID=A0A811K483_9BILA|nr:unnamed protein product [Bursaphelenchus okinawaensis]CAG9091057.1 unnamed protein product [Bursaphelenchus okinawaensis]